MQAKYWTSDDGATVYVSFKLKPSDASRAMLKGAGFKFNGKARRW